MDMRTGEIHEGLFEDEVKKRGLKKMTSEEAEELKKFPKELRPIELETRRYMAKRPHFKGMIRASVAQAFREGYLAAEINNKD